MKTTTITKTLKSLVIASAIIGSSALFAADGASLYNKCAGCHGTTGEKVALGKSKVIANMSEDEINIAINGYKAGTYGGAMKGLMKGQVASLSEDDVKAVSAHIASLKK
ncbi:c-type cytochrome [Candidatus Sulfurimonas marisnigri]|uniref:C-type cytochrome n=1 Tax=Candidatus Sulfurimonas marisnigri TaxID=2740405 RepID=A0A7S7M0E1_9BACT|nr:c-type cytochrome [Candidatus Sulfurimonas marisnigri]QOY54801.1 c-type cytochrome [Candidatus Sulfurimonas marisnigri]